jgi:hypothetical protein
MTAITEIALLEQSTDGRFSDECVAKYFHDQNEQY